jgi:PST family polysaccharide transporter
MPLNSRNDQISLISSESLPQAAQIVVAEGKTSYHQILKSSVLVGGSSAMNIVVKMINTKAMALLLGPGGFGLFGLYGSIGNLSQSIAGMGVNSSGVRQIAHAVGSGDSEKVARTATVLRITSIFFGVLGSLLLITFCRQVSAFTFGNDQHAAAISLLSISVFFQLVSNGQAALIQGMRRVLDLAKIGILGGLLGTPVGIIAVYFLREKGVVPSMIIAALMSLIISWWYSRKMHIRTASITVSQLAQEAGALLSLGLVFMTTGFMTMGVAYGVRIIVLRKFGFASMGCYQSAWTLGALYAGFILGAMAVDFYPRLTASAHDNNECNRLVNEQARIGLLLAGPGVIATLTIAPVIIELFYSSKFGAAVDVLRWICLGTVLQVVTWPLSFIIVAKGRRAIFFGTELAWTVASLALAWMCMKFFGLNGAGIAFFGSYAFYGLLLYPVVHQLSGFRWSSTNRLIGLLFLSLITIVFCGFYLLPHLAAACIGSVAALLSGGYSIRVLIKLITWEQIPLPLQRLFFAFRLGRSDYNGVA